MWQLPSEVPKLLLGSAVPDFPGAVGLLAAASGTEQVGIRTDRLFVENFKKPTDYSEAIRTFLEKREYKPAYPEIIDIAVTDKDRKKARKVISSLSGSIYGAIGPRSMQMWNKIAEADFLKYFGIVREGFDGQKPMTGPLLRCRYLNCLATENLSDLMIFAIGTQRKVSTGL